MKQEIITHLAAAIFGAVITFIVLELRDKPQPIPIDPNKYRIEERIRIDREVVKPLLDSLTSSIETIEELQAMKPRTKIIYKERQNENLNLSDSASFNLLRERLRSIELP